VTRIGVYPGSFNPPTVAHLAIADAARRQRRLERVELVVSTVALAKEHVDLPRLEHRIAVLEEVADRVSWLSVRITEARLLVDIAEGYSVLIMGADKWTQVNDPRWYGDERERDRALERLPELAVAPRRPHVVPEEHRLDVPADVVEAVSSTAARAGNPALMVPEARSFAERTGAWIDELRYRAWLTD
jgi:hypothetical protein